MLGEGAAASRRLPHTARRARRRGSPRRPEAAATPPPPWRRRKFRISPAGRRARRTPARPGPATPGIAPLDPPSRHRRAMRIGHSRSSGAAAPVAARRNSRVDPVPPRLAALRVAASLHSQHRHLIRPWTQAARLRLFFGGSLPLSSGSWLRDLRGCCSRLDGFKLNDAAAFASASRFLRYSCARNASLSLFSRFCFSVLSH
jgi:hypothetical protein